MKDQIAFYQHKLAYEMDPSDLFKALEDGENVIPLDARRTEGFRKTDLYPGPSILHREMNEASASHLDRSKTYVCYCDGIGCNASTTEQYLLP